MRSATRELVNAHGSAALMRRLSPNLSRAIALAVVGLALVVSSSVALAAGLTVGLATPTTNGLTCDPFNGCSATVSGNLTGSTPGSYSLQFTLVGIPDADLVDPNATQWCFAAKSGEINQAILNFTGAGATGQVVLDTGGLCVPPTFMEDPTKPLTKFSVPFTVHSGNLDFLGATGSGSLDGQFPNSIFGGPTFTFLTVNSPDFNVPSLTCTDPNGCNGNPNPGATPELDSIVLFGSGLSGIVAYAVRRRRAGKLRS